MITESKIGFTGTQVGMTWRQRQTLRRLLPWGKDFHHGDCVGSDAQAHDIAHFQGLLITIHPPENLSKRAFKSAHTILPPKPYLDRNKDIVDACEVLIATPSGKDELLRSGTWSTVRYARKLGKHILIIFPDGKIKKDPPSGMFVQKD